MFPTFSSLTLYEWLVIVLALTVVIVLTRRAWRRFTAEATAAIAKKAGDILSKLPNAINADQQNKLFTFSEHVRRLRQEKAQGDWIRIGVVVRGYYNADRMTRDETAHAAVLLNIATGEMKAPPPDERAFTTTTTAHTQWWQTYCGKMHTPLTALCAPRWQGISESTDIVLLGETYYFH